MRFPKCAYRFGVSEIGGIEVICYLHTGVAAVTSALSEELELGDSSEFFELEACISMQPQERQRSTMEQFLMLVGKKRDDLALVDICTHSGSSRGKFSI